MSGDVRYVVHQSIMLTNFIRPLIISALEYSTKFVSLLSIVISRFADIPFKHVKWYQVNHCFHNLAREAEHFHQNKILQILYRKVSYAKEMIIFSQKNETSHTFLFGVFLIVYARNAICFHQIGTPRQSLQFTSKQHCVRTIGKISIIY